MLWTLIVAVPAASLAVFFEFVRRAPLMEETEHGLISVRDERPARIHGWIRRTREASRAAPRGVVWC